MSTPTLKLKLVDYGEDMIVKIG